MQLNKGYKGLISQLFHNLENKKKHLRCRKCLISSGGDSRIRTGDPMLAKHVLYQLSYTPDTQKKPGWCPASSRDWQS